MHQQEINRINEILQELNLLLPVVGQSHQVFADITIGEESTVQRIDLAIMSFPEKKDEDNKV